MGFVLINCGESHINNIIEQLKKIDAVKDIQKVFGIYDIIVKVKTDKKNIFTEIVSSQIRKIDKLKFMLTLMVSNPEGDYL